MSEPAYKEQDFICVKCLKKYKITLTTKSEIVLIEELDREGMSSLAKFMMVLSYISMVLLVIYGFQTIKPMSPFYIIGSACLILAMTIPAWITIKEWMSKRRGHK